MRRTLQIATNISLVAFAVSIALYWFTSALPESKGLEAIVAQLNAHARMEIVVFLSALASLLLMAGSWLVNRRSRHPHH